MLAFLFPCVGDVRREPDGAGEIGDALRISGDSRDAADDAPFFLGRGDCGNNGLFDDCRRFCCRSSALPPSSNPPPPLPPAPPPPPLRSDAGGDPVLLARRAAAPPPP
eukprot:Rhum_TRINITY_DN14488_c28_g1::Rhum_TRINITY_DN14488_c28_g1_i1::g.92752::m.92752